MSYPVPSPEALAVAVALDMARIEDPNATLKQAFDDMASGR